MTETEPFVSIVIPCRNEERFIGRCIDSVLQQDYPMNDIEVLIVDGRSNDKTREIVLDFAAKYPFIKLLDNEKKIVPSALNAGIRSARGEIIVRMDAHSIYAFDYISKCLRYLEEFGCDNVGGIWITKPGNDTVIARSIAVALSHPFGVGNAYYRIGSPEPRFVDTVPFGCYRKEVFEKIGFFDEDLVRNQDDEFNMRLIKNGGKILLAPEIVSNYYARETFSKLWKMYYQYGYFKPLVAQKVGAVLTVRQLVPTLFTGSLLGTLLLSLFYKPFIWLFVFIIAIYALVNIPLSFLIAVKKRLEYFFVLPVTFATIHFGYGIGYLKGILDFVILRKNRKKKIEDLPLSR